MATTADDPIRADVERILRSVVDATLSAPSDAARSVRRCLRRRVAVARDTVVQPVRIVSSFFDLVAGGPVTRATSRSTSPSAAVVEASASDAPPTITDAPTDAADDVDLPIEEYESLAASQIVARLDGLSPAELRATRQFEVTHRGRRTVLGKIDQLLDGA